MRTRTSEPHRPTERDQRRGYSIRYGYGRYVHQFQSGFKSAWVVVDRDGEDAPRRVRDVQAAMDTARNLNADEADRERRQGR